MELTSDPVNHKRFLLNTQAHASNLDDPVSIHIVHLLGTLHIKMAALELAVAATLRRV